MSDKKEITDTAPTGTVPEGEKTELNTELNVDELDRVAGGMIHKIIGKDII